MLCSNPFIRNAFVFRCCKGEAFQFFLDLFENNYLQAVQMPHGTGNFRKRQSHLVAAYTPSIQNVPVTYDSMLYGTRTAKRTKKKSFKTIFLSTILA